MSLTDEDKQWIAAQLEGVEQRISRRFDQTERRFDSLDMYVADFRTEAIGRLGATETQMRLLAGSQQSFDARIPAITKAAHENASAISYLIGKQMERTASNFDLAERVAKLEEKVSKLVDPAA